MLPLAKSHSTWQNGKKTKIQTTLLISIKCAVKSEMQNFSANRIATKRKT